MSTWTREDRIALRRQLAETEAWWEAQGYRPCKAAVCPRLVAGKHCVRFNGPERLTCICERYPLLLDHPRIWRRDGRYVFTSEPYWVAEDALAAYVIDLATLGLVVSEEPYSPHAPGSTHLLMVTRADTHSAKLFAPLKGRSPSSRWRGVGVQVGAHA